MPSANKVLVDMQFEKYKDLRIDLKRRVEFMAEEMAKERGYTNLKELKDTKPYLYRQLIADAMGKLKV
jgi:hypothetical protein